MNLPLDPLTVPLRGSRLIEASAGTGKTWTIAALFVRLVLGHGDERSAFTRPLLPSEILVMTFTVAATRELSRRIRERLVEAARVFRGGDAIAADDPFLARLVDAYPAGPVRDHAAWRLAAAAEAMDDAAVVTIDAWVQRMLREHAFDSGSTFDEQLEPDQDAMLAEAAHDYWRQQVYALRGTALDDALALWATPDRLIDDVRALMPRLAEASRDDAGDRDQDGIDRDEHPQDDRGPAQGFGAEHDPTALVSSDAAGRSLADVHRAGLSRRRAAVAAWKAGWSPRFAAMHAWLAREKAKKSGPFTQKLSAKRVDGWFAALVAWANDPERIDFGITNDARHRLSPAGLRECVADGAVLDLPAGFEAFARLPDSPGLDVTAIAMRLHAARHVKARIRALKRQAGIFGFQDLLERLDEALAGAAGEALRQRIVGQFPAALIDEFQDTSPLQYRVFDRLYRIGDDDPATALLLIGDPKQSIYGFRGADIHSYLRARVATGGRHDLLSTNHRATTGLVAAVNRLFDVAEQRGSGAFRFGTGDDRSLPFVPVAAHGRDATFVSRAGEVPAVTIVHDDEATARRDVLKRFAERAAENVSLALGDAACGFRGDDGTFTRLRPADIALLVRDRLEATVVRHALRRRDIASVFLSDRDSIFASDEAADLLHWLRAVAAPLDSRRARVAFATRFVGLSVTQLQDLARDERQFESRLEQLGTLHRIWLEQGVLSMLRQTLHMLELPARWLAADGERSLTNVLHLAELLQSASGRLDGEQALIRWLGDRIASDTRRSDDDVVRLESDADLVQVVTIHKAKGLEYPVVYLPFASGVREFNIKGGVAWLPDADGTRRLLFEIDADVRGRALLEERQEDLRLFYVALTRARHALWLGVAPTKVRRAVAFHESALGYLLTAGTPIAADELAAVLRERFAGLAAVRLEAACEGTPVTRLVRTDVQPPLHDAPLYDAAFERDWSIGSFSALVRDLPRGNAVGVVDTRPRDADDAAAVAFSNPVRPQAIVDVAVEEELLTGPSDDDGMPGPSEGPDDRAAVPSPRPARHRFPRGAVAGNFLHDQLEWLGRERFAITRPDVRRQLIERCVRHGWARRTDDLLEWLDEVVATPLTPVGVALDGLPVFVSEMEFWFPSERLDARAIDRLCRRHLLGGRARSALPGRALHGMLMGFMDLVFEVDGRYWVLDYKSNALGPDDGAYTADALEHAMAHHRYDVQGAIYLLALHRLLRQRLGAHYDPERQLGGALYLFLRGVRTESTGCHVLPPDLALLDALDRALDGASDPSDDGAEGDESDEADAAWQSQARATTKLDTPR